MVPYSTTKAAVIGLTKALGKELAETEVRVNCITPAVVRTAILDQTDEAMVEYMISRIPMQRTGQIAEIASLVAWIASEECSFSTGAVFDISGGPGDVLVASCQWSVASGQWSGGGWASASGFIRMQGMNRIVRCVVSPAGLNRQGPSVPGPRFYAGVPDFSGF